MALSYEGNLEVVGFGMTTRQFCSAYYFLSGSCQYISGLQMYLFTDVIKKYPHSLLSNVTGCRLSFH